MDDDQDEDMGVMSALPGLARIGVGAWWRTTTWTASATARTYGRMLRAASSGESAAQFLSETGEELRGYARRVLGLMGEEPPPPRAYPRSAAAERNGRRSATLRERGEELLRQSTDVRLAEDAHPAYERILSELAPDEGRILRLLAVQGPQPAVDVRTGGPLGPISSELIAPGLSMIGAEAGCRYVERVPAYLNNLYRLGLVWFSREPVSDNLRYQVLEAQPDVLAAFRQAGRAKTVRRSIHLTPFGEDFCSVCLPLDTIELDALTGERLPAGAD